MFASNPFASIPFASQSGISDIVSNIETGAFLLSGAGIGSRITSRIESDTFLLTGANIVTYSDIVSSFETGVFLLTGSNLIFIDTSNLVVTGKNRTFSYFADARLFALLNDDRTIAYHNGGC